MLLSRAELNQLGLGMQVNLRWIGGAAFQGETGSGHRIITDGPEEGGGRNIGPRPMEVLLLGMAACSSYDVVTILRKGRQEIADCLLEVNGTRAEEDPKVFTDIHLHFIVIGRQVKSSLVERAINLSAERYCSASIMLGKTAKLTHSYEIREQDS